MSIVFYNPSSKKRSDYLRRACKILLKYKSPDTVCGIARNIGRREEAFEVMTLAELCRYNADMFTTIFVGSMSTVRLGGKMVTPRGYEHV